MSYITTVGAAQAEGGPKKKKKSKTPLDSNDIMADIWKDELSKPRKTCFNCTQGLHLECTLKDNCRCPNLKKHDVK